MKKFTSLLIVLLLRIGVFGQMQTISGIVQNELHEPVPFATVTVQGSKMATQADADGKFILKADPHSRLVFSASGYTAKTVVAAEAASVILSTSASAQMTEVVVATAL